MADVNPTETGLTVKICDGTASEKVAVLTTTPSSSEAALVVREVEKSSEYVEDSVHTDGDTGVFTLTVRNDTLASLVDTDGDYAPLQVNSDGALYVDVAAFSVGTIQVEGNVAHDDVDSGNPVKIGAVARTTNPTAVADGDRTDVMADDLGRLVVLAGHVRDQQVKQSTLISNSTAETTILTTGGAGVFNDITSISITSDKEVEITLRDATSGATIWVMEVDQKSSQHFVWTPALIQTTANNNWTAQLDLSNADVNILISGVQNV